jgi:hypothetical protein
MDIQIPKLTPRRGAPRKLDYLKTKAISVRLPQWLLDRLVESGESQAQQIVQAFIDAYGWSPRAPGAAALELHDKSYIQKTGQGDELMEIAPGVVDPYKTQSYFYAELKFCKTLEAVDELVAGMTPAIRIGLKDMIISKRQTLI